MILFDCSFLISVKNPVYAATTGNEIQLERPKGSITAPSRSRDNQQTYQGLVISHGKLCLVDFYTDVKGPTQHVNANLYRDLF